MAEVRSVVLWVGRGPIPKALRNGAAGLNVLCAQNADEALVCVERDDPAVDVVVFSKHTANASGAPTLESVFERIREMDPDLPLLVIAPGRDILLAVGRERATALPEGAHHGSFGSWLQKEIENALKKRTNSYDIVQRQLANLVASRYEALERTGPGTEAYWAFEEELIRGIVAALARDHPLIRILDLGCGTGRCICAALEAAPRKVQVFGVDMAGGMIAEATRKTQELKREMDQISLKRGLAERLPRNIRGQTFDLVMMAFGFPCYTPTMPVLKEAASVLAPNGVLLASIYNHNALYYEVWNDGNFNQCPIATRINRIKGTLEIPGAAKSLPGVTYTIAQFERMLHHVELHPGGFATFPVIYSTLPSEELLKRQGGKRPPDYTRNPLWLADKSLSLLLRDRGYYGIFVASKNEETAHKLAQKLDLRTDLNPLGS